MSLLTKGFFVSPIDRQKPAFMAYKTYRSLSSEGLYELLASSVRDMLIALDTKEDNLIAYKSIRRQVELLLEVIDEKKIEIKEDGVSANANPK
jgi:hypothetical protein